MSDIEEVTLKNGLHIYVQTKQEDLESEETTIYLYVPVREDGNIPQDLVGENHRSDWFNDYISLDYYEGRLTSCNGVDCREYIFNNLKDENTAQDLIAKIIDQLNKNIKRNTEEKENPRITRRTFFIDHENVFLPIKMEEHSFYDKQKKKWRGYMALHLPKEEDNKPKYSYKDMPFYISQYLANPCIDIDGVERFDFTYGYGYRNYNKNDKFLISYIDFEDTSEANIIGLIDQKEKEIMRTLYKIVAFNTKILSYNMSSIKTNIDVTKEIVIHADVKFSFDTYMGAVSNEVTIHFPTNKDGTLKKDLVEHNINKHVAITDEITYHTYYLEPLVGTLNGSYRDLSFTVFYKPGVEFIQKSVNNGITDTEIKEMYNKDIEMLKYKFDNLAQNIRRVYRENMSKKEITDR